jgi:hypothetical protein
MRTLIFILIVGLSSACHAETVASVDAAWQYLIKSTGSKRWVVISSKVNSGYFQCENLDTFVSCPMPVWRSVLPGIRLTGNAESRTNEPYPILQGSDRKEFLTEQQVAIARRVLQRFGLRSEDVHSQLIDGNKKEKTIVGTSFELRIDLSLDYQRFPELVEAYMVEVWGVSADKGYDFETAD